jgi:4-aminobutyrate aminotransferase
MWASEHFDFEPDVVLAGKGIASGMPLGALIARERLMTWEVGAHGSTYGGNPLSCAAALATLELIEHGLMDNARDVGAVLLDGLRQIQARQPSIREVRGLGLMIGVQFVDHDTMVAVERTAFRRGLLVLGAGDDVIRVSPPLVLRRDQADTALQVFEDAIADVASGA